MWRGKGEVDCIRLEELDFVLGFELELAMVRTLFGEERGVCFERWGGYNQVWAMP